MELHASLNVLDYIVLGIILISGLFAIMSGFVREIYSLFNWTASYFIAVKFYTAAEPYVKKYISNPTTVTDVSIFVVFCVSFIVLAIVGMVVTRLIIRGHTLTAIDRSLGFVFGLVRGFLIACLVYLVAATILWPDIDKQPVPASEQQEQQAQKDEPQKADGKHSLTMSAPHWLLEARTRPLLAHGANLLKEFIPEKVLEKTTAEYLDKKDEMETKARDNVINLTNPTQ
jgi:membrane protein required for colicin V production